MKKLYKKMFYFVADKRGVDYAINLEYEYGVAELIAEAYDLGFKHD